MMTTAMPDLETQRLLIRPFVMADLQDVYRLMDVELAGAEMGAEKMDGLAERAEWLQWAVLNGPQLAKLNQPPYGDRAVALRDSGQLIGACGFVPALSPFGQLSNFLNETEGALPVFSTPEFALFYAISPTFQRQGYAFEAARALVDYAFQQLHVKRVIAETSVNNAGSMGVMRKLGMCIEKNPLPEPLWLEVVGMMDNPALTA